MSRRSHSEVLCKKLFRKFQKSKGTSLTKSFWNDVAHLHLATWSKGHRHQYIPKCTKTWRHHSSRNIKTAITQSKMKILVKNVRSTCCLSFWRNLIHQISKNRSHFCANNPNPFLHIMYSEVKEGPWFLI